MKVGEGFQEEIPEPLIFAEARRGNYEALWQYLALGGDTEIRNGKGHTLLKVTSYYGHEEVSALLLEHGAKRHEGS